MRAKAEMARRRNECLRRAVVYAIGSGGEWCFMMWTDHLATLRSTYQRILRATLFSNRPEFRPTLVNGIAAREADTLLAFLASPDESSAYQQGKQLCHTGLSEESVLALCQATRRFCLSTCADDERAVMLETVELYCNAIVRGFTAKRVETLLLEQERIRSALQRTNVRYAMQMEVAADISRAATSILDLNELLQTAVELIRSRFDLYYVAIFLVDAEGRWATLQASAGEAGQVMLRRGHRLKVGGDSLVGWCIAHGEPHIALDVGEKAISFDTPLLTDIHSEMVLPLVSRGKAVGALAVQSKRVGVFSDQDMVAFRVTADQIANGIQNARLFRERERRIAELSTLNEMGRAFSSAMEFDDLLKLVHQQAARIFDTNYLAIAAHNVDVATWDVVSYSRQGIEHRDRAQTLGNDILGYIARSKASVLLGNRRDQVAFCEAHHLSPNEEHCKSLLGVPLIAADIVVGVMLIMSDQHEEYYGPPDLEILSTIASQVAIAFENARLYKQLRQELLERQYAAESLREAKEAAETASRSKSTFLANMSHELRTPLTGIIGYSELLQREAQLSGYPEIVPDLEKIQKAGNHLLAIINDILDLSKIEAGKMTLNIEEFDFVSLIQEVSSTALPLIAKNGNTFELSVSDSIGNVRSDLTKMRQIILNLLSNAGKFTHNGSVRLHARRYQREKGDYITIDVTDTGIGIADSELLRLFHDFSQAAPITTHKYGGTGLGLSLSRRLCAMLGGDISVESAYGAGSTFTVRFPAVIADPATPKIEPAQEYRQINTTATLDELFSMSDLVPERQQQMLVLVIDDDPTTRELLHRSLSADDVSVVMAADGEEGLLLVQALHPDVVILDVLLPGVDGWSVLSTIKGSPESADIPVIMLTIVDDRDKGFVLGAHDYLTKPIDNARLTALVRGLCDNRQANADVSPTRILVAEDDAQERKQLCVAIEQAGWQAIEAASGAEVVASVRACAPDLILLDLMLADHDGVQIVEQLRTSEPGHAPPIIGLTSKTLSLGARKRISESVQQILQQGKYSSSDLLQYIRQVLLNHKRPSGQELVHDDTAAS
jgi:signal transduction histidine kinase/DNA-binding response OmpR family regulator